MMPPFCECCGFWLLMITVSSEAFSQRRGLTLECVENVMKLTLDSSLSLGRHLEIEAINGSHVVPLSPALAAQCGYSFESDPWGNMRIYTSLLGCFAYNHDDAVFDIGLRLQLYGNRMSDDVIEVEKTCEYNQWASREILCERNFMEVSVHRGHHDTNVHKQAIHPVTGIVGFLDDEQDSTSLGNIWRMVFYTPEEKPMTLAEVKRAGYGVSVTPTRLVLRSPYNKPETYTDDVNGVQMEFLRVSTYFKRAWSVTIIDSIAVCPVGGLHFTNQLIKWYMPQYIAPLMTNPQHQVLEIYMGINGKRLTAAEMQARGYTMVINELQIVISLPVGGPDGYYKSDVLDYKYHVTYNIEPMLEMLWLEGESEVTRYKVHYPIITPPERQLPCITNNTDADSEVFRITLGFFLPDVKLSNITLSTGLLSVEEANERGYNVQEHLFANNSKAFSLEVPFFDPAVLRTKDNPVSVIYSLSLTFGLLVLPGYSSFSHSALVEATRKDIIMFTMNGSCDARNFYVTIGHGNQDVNFRISVGTSNLSADLYTEYSVKENATHINMTVPFLAKDVVFEESSQSSLRARVDVVISRHTWQFKKFTLACSFPFIMTECFANGSITALAVKAEAATRMIPSRLTLRDPSCKPTFSNNRFAYFSFNANSCQTTRTFHDGIMTYRNEISMSDATSLDQPLQNATKSGPEYRVTVVCSYERTKTLALTFSPGPQASALLADPGFGELHVRMRLAKDASFDSFHEQEDYPVIQYLKHPLFFEVELMQSIDPQIELVLQNCWASANHSGSMLTWDLIVNGCPNPADNPQITFYPVTPDERVRCPSHVRRFKIEMFTFVQDDLPLHDQIRVHCETILCDVHHMDGVCNTFCPLNKDEDVKRGRRTAGHGQHRMWVSSGKMFLSTLNVRSE